MIRPSPELPDLDIDRLESLARAATAGPWLHRCDPGNTGAQHCVKLGGENGAWVCDCIDNADRNTVGGIAGERNAAFIAAANPAAVLTLIALARRAQPEGEAPQAVAPKRLEGREIFEIAAPYFAWNAPSWHKATQGAVGMTGLLAFAEALLKAVSAAQHAEAPQAGNALAVAVERHYPHTETQRQLDQLAAFIKGYQAAQHAESGAQARVIDCMDSWAKAEGIPTYSELRAALAAQSQGAQALPAAGAGDPDLDAARWAEVFYRNAETFTVRDLGIVRAAWKEATLRAALAAKAEAPALDDLATLVRRLVRRLEKDSPGTDLAAQALDYLKRKGLAGSPLRAQQAAAPGALDPNVFFDALSDFKDSRMTADDGQEFFDKLAAPSAPGTPEAPSRDAILEEAAKAIEHDGDWCGGHGMPSVPSPSECAKKIRSLKRAAQLDTAPEAPKGGA
ncbi:hypothetical protein [Massilia timonae]|uniref:hypothetical protein n=1 Tax=Massilia timonae TaxID=47229 RepID=UPI0028D0018E|nr:hypothetical protein [Massilia timonae]